MPTDTPPAKKRGRPATGNNRRKISISLPIELSKLAGKDAAKRGESLSQYIARAVQTQVLNAP